MYLYLFIQTETSIFRTIDVLVECIVLRSPCFLVRYRRKQPVCTVILRDDMELPKKRPQLTFLSKKKNK